MTVSGSTGELIKSFEIRSDDGADKSEKDWLCLHLFHYHRCRCSAVIELMDIDMVRLIVDK